MTNVKVKMKSGEFVDAATCLRAAASELDLPELVVGELDIFGELVTQEKRDASIAQMRDTTIASLLRVIDAMSNYSGDKK